MEILFVSLGCDKNLVDTEKMMGLLASRGHTFTDDEERARAVVVNTCCFIGDAKEESVNTILEMAERKKSGQIQALVVCGCLAERYREQIREEIPEVDAVVGTAATDRIADALEGAAAGRCADYADALTGLPLAEGRRVVTTGGHYAYLKIAEGCDRRCTYCVIPQVRGGYRSVPMETLAAEARELAETGVKELILVAQETTRYGVDIYGEKKLPELLRRLSGIEGLVWIRILYCYPEEITEELIEAVRSLPKVCHYLDIPIQHASDGVLKRMGRRTDQQQLRRIVYRLRERIPDICLRTTLISGFPGETQEDFEDLYRFVNEMEFDRLGVFAYSQEEDTPAASMEPQVPEEVRNARRDELMELQQAIAFEKAEAKVGVRLSAMVEGRVADEDVYAARTYMDAPEVDGFLFIRTGRQLMTGDVVQVVVTGSNAYDLIGELEDEFTE